MHKKGFAQKYVVACNTQQMYLICSLCSLTQAKDSPNRSLSSVREVGILAGVRKKCNSLTNSKKYKQIPPPVSVHEIAA